MNGYQVSATIHDYNNPGQKESQKMITELDTIYNCPEYKNTTKTKIYDNGLTRGVKITIYCWSLQEVCKQIKLLSLNITELLGEHITKGGMPSVKIILTERL